MLKDEALDIAQIGTPAAPASGRNKVYPKSDGKVYVEDSSGVEQLVGPGTSTAGPYLVVAATTANITLSGAQTIDGISVVAGNRVLVKDQTTVANNGLYLASASTWTRTTDADTAVEVSSLAFVQVQSGTANGGTRWSTVFKSTDTLGTTAMRWYREPIIQSGTVSVSLAASSTGHTTVTFATQFPGTPVVTATCEDSNAFCAVAAKSATSVDVYVNRGAVVTASFTCDWQAIY